MVPAGFRQTTPHNDFGWSVPLWPGHAVQKLDFGSAKAPLRNAAISGSFFKELNGNGERDAGDADTWDTTS